MHAVSKYFIFCLYLHISYLYLYYDRYFSLIITRILEVAKSSLLKFLEETTFLGCWTLDTKIHLQAMCLKGTTEYGNDAFLQEKSRAMTFSLFT